MSIRGSAIRATLVVGLCAGVCSMLGVAAQATVTHKLLSRISTVPVEGPKGEPVPAPGPIQDAAAMTVDEGKLYLLDGPPYEGRLDEFDASTGTFVAQLARTSALTPHLEYMRQGVAVGHATGATTIYAGADAYPEGGPEGAVAVFGASGELQAIWDGKSGTPQKEEFGCFECSGRGDVAVDSSANPGDWAAGDVFVAAPVKKVVYVFKPTAGGGKEFVTELSGPEPGVEFTRPTAVAIDSSNGDLFVGDGEVVDVFEPTALDQYTLIRTITSTPNGAFAYLHAMAVDGEKGELYVAEGEEIDEFSVAGTFLGRLNGTPDDQFFGGIAIDPVSHRLLVGSASPVEEGSGSYEYFVDIFGSDTVLPDVVTGSVSGLAAYNATLNGTVNPVKAGPASCGFEWGTSPSLGQVIPCSQTIDEGESPVPVHAVLENLQPDTTYYYRLQATNANGTNVDESSPPKGFTTLGPGLHGESVNDVSATSATLQATINAHSEPTSYYFQYGTTTAYGAYSPVPEGSPSHGRLIGASGADVSVEEHLQGLAPASSYHYRVVVMSEIHPGEIEVFDGFDQSFTTQGSGQNGLPDGRAWEMVSPPEKHGADLAPISEQNGLIEAAAAGQAFTYVANVPTEGQPRGYADTVQVLAARDVNGWASRDMTVPHLVATGKPVGSGPEYQFFSEDLSSAIVAPLGPLDPELSDEASEQTPFLHSNYRDGSPGIACTSACYHPLVTAVTGHADVPPGTTFGGSGGAPGAGSNCYTLCGPSFVAATPDLSHVVVSSLAGLTTGPGSAGGLYEWFEGRLQYVGSAEGSSHEEGTVIGNGGDAAEHAVSDDGSRIVFRGSAEGSTGLLMRDMVKNQIVKLDAGQGGNGEGASNPLFQGASSDGARVFFTDETALTQDSGATFGKADLYECQIVEAAGRLACRLSDLTPRTPSGERASVQGRTLGINAEGTRIYLVAEGVLAAGGQPGHCGRVPGAACGLYVLHDDGHEWQSPRFIAMLGGEDHYDWGERLSGQPTRVSPDGRWLVFMSEQPLVRYDNRDVSSGRPVVEVYLYDASSGSLTCPSCDPTGARPNGVEYRRLEAGNGGLAGGQFEWATTSMIAANVPAWQQVAITGGPERYQSRYLSNDGRLFFNSDDALVPQDVDGTEDVYEYEPDGVGSCTVSAATFNEISHGCVTLISSGESAQESAFLDASEGGGDVFFLTSAKLSSQDFDTSVDVYDARECTQLAPCAAAVAPSPVCSTGDACKPAPTPQPAAFGAPASATFSGAGNVVVAGASHATTSGRSLNRSQRLTRALRACRKRHGARRRSCERTARRRYGRAGAGKVNAKKKGGR